MNRINFDSGVKFPMYKGALERMQDGTLLSAMLALLGGDNYILSGGQNDGNDNISDGYIVIDGEIMPLRGGPVQARITVTETRESVNAFGVTYPEIYVNRYAEFSATGEYIWDDFVQVSSNTQLQKRISDIQGDVPGTVKMWAGLVSRIPSDYRLCDGSELAVQEYVSLFENIGNAFGGNGQTAFNLPDLRDRFVVGYNSAQDSEYNVIGNKGGSEKVTLIAAQLPAHDHTATDITSFNKLSARAGDIDNKNTPGVTDSNGAEREYRVGGMSEPQWREARIRTVGENQPHENRPPYFVLAYIIKIK